jgi:hypothetical protein
MHLWPTEFAAQDAHALPFLPHTVSPVPPWHCVPSQQPPLHSWPAVQPVPHTPPVHAWPAGQSLAA